jgi:hypothetical protein
MLRVRRKSAAGGHHTSSATRGWPAGVPGLVTLTRGVGVGAAVAVMGAGVVARLAEAGTGAEEMASVAEQWAEQAEGVAANAETAVARLGQKLAELQAELQVRCRWIHSAHGSGSGATPPVCLSWCPHTPAHGARPRTAPRRGHAFSLWSGCGVFGAYPGWAGHAGGLQASRRRLSEAERAEQLRLRLRAEEEAAAAVAAAAKAATEGEEAAALPHGSGGMGCSLSVLLMHAGLFPGHPGVLGQSSAGPQQRAWVRGWAACWMSWVRALTAVCDDGGGDEESQLLPPPRRGEATQLALRASSFLDAAAEAEALGQKQGQQRAGEAAQEALDAAGAKEECSGGPSRGGW